MPRRPVGCIWRRRAEPECKRNGEWACRRRWRLGPARKHGQGCNCFHPLEQIADSPQSAAQDIVAQKSRSEKSLRSGVGLVGQDRCDAKRGAAYGFCFRHRWISTAVAGASCSHHHGRARGSAIDAARSRENWSLSIRTFAPASELHSPRGGSFVEGRQFPIFERPNSSYNRGTVPVPGAASSLYEGRLDGPLAGRVGVLPIFRVESAEV